MRGDYIPRIYQTLGAMLVVYCARAVGGPEIPDRVEARFVAGAFALALFANASIAFGPIARVPWAGHVYQRFYHHACMDSMDQNLAAHGRRPLGFCRW